MVDRLSPEARSRNMARITGKDTSPEMIVRRLLHSMGYRYRLHVRALPGRPDIAFPGRKKAVLVHGCFWHRHAGCRYAYTPKSRVEFWEGKFARNIIRDARNAEALVERGWQAIVVWECETKAADSLRDRLDGFLGPAKSGVA
jgi:DNA mismatch endonuclease, patch repair protein